MTKNRNVHFQSLILWKNNDKKLVGVNVLTRKKKFTSKAKKMELFYCFKWNNKREKSPVALHTGWRDVCVLMAQSSNQETGQNTPCDQYVDISDSHHTWSVWQLLEVLSWQVPQKFNGSLNTNIEELTTEMSKKSLEESFTASAVCFKLGKLCIYFQHSA